MLRIMKLVLLCGGYALTWASTTTGAIVINVSVPTSCTISFNVPNVNITLMQGAAGTGSTILAVGCTNGATASLAITSLNNWQLHGVLHGANLSYTLVYPGGGQTSGAFIPSNTWSGGVAGRVVLSGTATTSDWIIPLNITTATVGSGSLADTYTDAVTFVLSY